MLSAESASGSYPLEAVATMDRIAREVEQDPNYVDILRAQRTQPEATSADAISAAARQIAETLHLQAICCYTASGATAMRAARERPQTPILAMSPVIGTVRRLSLVWGLHCVFGEEPKDLDGMVNRACQVALEEGFAQPGGRIILTAGVPMGTPGATNMLRIAYIASDGRGGI
jgi:pyruvate kinase